LTVRAIGGLVLFNVAILGVGSALLWGLAAYRWLTDVVRLAGVAYFVGLASVIVVLSLELVIGVPVTGLTSILSLVALAVGGIAFGLWRGRSRLTVHPPDWRFPRISIFVAVTLAGIVVYFEGLFRQARLASALAEFDGWWNWIPKAKAIYYFGRLDVELLGFLPNQPYPPGLPAVHALAFHAMGSADDVTLHLQYWFYAVGMIAAWAGLLAPRVRPAIFAPLVFLILLAPSFVTWATRTYVDLPLGYLVATAALLVLLWIQERHTWQLVGATILLAGAMLTKREGILFVLCVLLAGFAASAARRRACWPWLAAAGIIAFVLALPWRIWFMTHGVPSDAPSGGVVSGLGDVDRGWATVKLVVRTFFETDAWLLAPYVGVAAIALGLLARAWLVSIYASAFVLSAAAAATWTIWAERDLPIVMADDRNPIIRMTGTSILVLVAVAPLLLELAWSAGRARLGSTRLAAVFAWRPLGAWTIVVAAGLVMPVSMAAGYSGHTLPGGKPRFPSEADCVTDPVPGEPVRVVIGYAGSYDAAHELRSRAAAAGVSGLRTTQDGCGRLRVHVDGFPTLAAAAPQVGRAQRANLDPTLELDPGS
jgi:hypothetical protein